MREIDARPFNRVAALVADKPHDSGRRRGSLARGAQLASRIPWSAAIGHHHAFHATKLLKPGVTMRVPEFVDAPP
jgi:hypothetical protein